MNILLAALGLGPFVQAPENAQFVTGLAKALSQLGHEVSVAAPYLPAYEQAGLLMGRRLSPLPLPDGRQTFIFHANLGSGIKLILLRTEGAEFAPDQDLLEQDKALGAFSLAVTELVAQAEQGDEPFDIIHAHGAHAGLCLLPLTERGGIGATKILSVHDASECGEFPHEAHQALGISAQRTGAHDFGSGAGVSLLKGLLTKADAVIAPSESYGKALLAPERHGALARAFRAVSPHGILCGVDLSVFNPSTDAVLTSRYDAPDPSNKARNKSALLAELGLEFELGRPLVFIEDMPRGDCAWQTVLAALPGLARNDLTFVLAVPDRLRAELVALTEPLRQQFCVVGPPDPQLRRRMLAAADFYLSIRRQDPFGQQLLQAARYGAIPIAYRTDAVADVVVDCDAELKTGTGFSYDTMTGRSLIGVAGRVVAAYRSPAFLGLVRRVMRQDFAWDRAARRHVQIYRQSTHAG